MSNVCFYSDLTVGYAIGQLSVYWRAALSATWRQVNLNSVSGTNTMNTCEIQSTYPAANATSFSSRMCQTGASSFF